MYIEHFLWIAGGFLLLYKLMQTIDSNRKAEAKEKMYNTINLLLWIIIVIIIEVVLYAVIYPDEIWKIKLLFA